MHAIDSTKIISKSDLYSISALQMLSANSVNRSHSWPKLINFVDAFSLGFLQNPFCTCYVDLLIQIYCIPRCYKAVQFFACLCTGSPVVGRGINPTEQMKNDRTDRGTTNYCKEINWSSFHCTLYHYWMKYWFSRGNNELPIWHMQIPHDSIFVNVILQKNCKFNGIQS